MLRGIRQETLTDLSSVFKEFDQLWLWPTLSYYTQLETFLSKKHYLTTAMSLVGMIAEGADCRYCEGLLLISPLMLSLEHLACSFMHTVVLISHLTADLKLLAKQHHVMLLALNNHHQPEHPCKLGLFALHCVFLQHPFYVDFLFHNQVLGRHLVSPQPALSLLMCCHRLLCATVKPPLFGCLGGRCYWFPVSQFS